MNKKSIAIILELIPVVAAPLAIALMVASIDSSAIRWVINICTLIGFLGFVFFIIGHKLGKNSKPVIILGVLDILATLSIIGFYVLAIFSFGL
ncbi:MAG: hypothetical protein K6G47_01215 [Clostridia bacterium]|nr:hypothetical protein [Clostridia bacterium]